MSSKYDLVVIGSGPGGYLSAIRAAQLGMKTVVIERDSPGGVCLNWGCIPSKAIIKCAEVYSYFNKSEDYGITHKGLSCNYSKVIDKSRGASSSLNKGVEFLLKKNKVDLIKGSAKLLRPGAVGIAGDEDSEIQGQKILLATGSVPRTIPGLDIDGKIVMTSDEAIMNRRIPKSIVIIGGGYIGVEFAYVYNAFGSKVTIVEMVPNIIPGADEDVSKELEKNFKKSGIEILTSTAYKSIKKTKTGAKITVADAASGKEKVLSAEMVLVAIGRKAVTNSAPTSFSFYGSGDSLGLDELGIETDEQGFIKTDESYSTTCSGVYAIGDVIGPPLLAHKASDEGVVAVERMNGMDTRVHYDNIPGCVYCQPEVASVGLTEKQANERGHNFSIGTFPFKASGKAVAVGEPEGFVKIIFSKDNGEILGAHIIGHGATELIAEIGTAKTLESTPYEIATTSHAHPTLSEAVMEAALAAMGRMRNF